MNYTKEFKTELTEIREILKDQAGHIEILNRESGELRDAQIKANVDISWIKEQLDKIESRTWFIISGIILSIIIQILFNIYG